MTENIKSIRPLNTWLARIIVKDWRDSYAIKSTYCSCRGPGYNSKHSDGDSSWRGSKSSNCTQAVHITHKGKTFIYTGLVVVAHTFTPSTREAETDRSL